MVKVNLAATTANAQGIELVTIAVAVACWNHLTPAVIYRTRTIADAAFIEGANAIVNTVANSIAVGIRSA